MQYVPVARFGRKMVNYGVQAVKQRRSRRRSQNKYVVGARMMNIPFNPRTSPRGRRRARRQKRRGNGPKKSFAVAKTTIANVRQNVSSVGDQQDIVVSNRERMVIDIPVSTTTNGEFDQWTFDPLSAVLPLLQQKAPLYAAYDIGFLSFRYVPRTGTSVNGTFYMAFTRELADPGSYSDPNQLTSMANMYCQCSDANGFTLRIPNGDLNENGNLLINNGDIAVEPTKYFAGQLIFGTTEVTDSIESVGKIECTYSIVLRRSRLPLETQNSAGYHANYVGTVTHRGVAWIEKVESKSVGGYVYYRNYSLTPSRLLLVHDGSAVVTNKAGTVIAATREAGETEILGDYAIPARTDFRISNGNTRWILRRDDGVQLVPN